MKSTLPVMGVVVAPFLISLSVEARVNSPESLKALRQANQHFPELIREFEVDCDDSFLQHQLSDDGNRLFFTCWKQSGPSKTWYGSYLGTLPLTPFDPSFKVPKLRCFEDNLACQNIVTELRSQFPKELESAEFKCATKSGTLTFNQDPNSRKVNLRCGFQAYSLTDENGNGVLDVEDTESSAGIDIPIQTVQLGDSTQTSQPRKNQEWDAFFNSQYTYWDAKVLSQFWNQDVGDAKARIGRKLLWGSADQAILEQFLLDARLQALESVESLELYLQSRYQYDDAQALAIFWGEATPYDAKLRIERNLIMGNEQVVKEALQLAS